MDVADQGDFNIVFMKFNRKGMFVAVQTDPDTTPLNLSKHFNYGSAKHGNWSVMDYDLFWELNADAVKQLCS
jgi:hypothetical protein